MFKNNELMIFKALKDSMYHIEAGELRLAYSDILLVMPVIALEALLVTAKPSPFSAPIDRAKETIIIDLARYVSGLVNIPDILPQNGSGNESQKLWLAKIATVNSVKTVLMWGRTKHNVITYLRDVMREDGELIIDDISPIEETQQIGLRYPAEALDKRDAMRLWRITDLNTNQKELVWARNLTQCMAIADTLKWEGEIKATLLDPPQEPTRILTER